MSAELNKLAHDILSGPLPSLLDERGFAKDGWCYCPPPNEIHGDCRKLVTLRQQGMTWVGIRAFSTQHRQWLNNNEPETADVVAWRDLYEPARGHWIRGEFYP